VKRMLRQHLSSTWTSFHESVMQSKANQTLHKVLNKVLKRMSHRPKVIPRL
jgi:phage tail tape-measure protein